MAIDSALLYDKTEGAWIGRVAGCQLGKPIEGWRRKELLRIFKDSKNYPLERYLRIKDIPESLITELNINRIGFWADNMPGAAFADDDTNYTVLSLKLMERFGKDFKSDDVLEAWLENMPFLAACTAERVAYKNAVAGMVSLETAIFKNPYREWIGAQIRTDFYGYCNPGKPEAAAELAYRDACISHTKNGIYGAMFAAAAVAAAFALNDVVEIVKAGISVIPQKSRLFEALLSILNMYENNIPFAEVINKVHKDYDEYTEYGWCHTIPNAMIVTASILYSKGDFSKGICMAVESAFDTDCNGATVGSVLGVLNGRNKIPEEWYKPFNGRLRTQIKENENVSVEDLAKRTINIIL